MALVYTLATVRMYSPDGRMWQVKLVLEKMAGSRRSSINRRRWKSERIDGWKNWEWKTVSGKMFYQLTGAEAMWVLLIKRSVIHYYYWMRVVLMMMMMMLMMLMAMVMVELLEVMMMTMTMSELMCWESGNKYALKWNPVLKFHAENNWPNPGKVKQFHSDDQMTECFWDSFSPYFSAKCGSGFH